MSDCGLDVADVFTLVTPHQEHAGLDAIPAAHCHRALHLLHCYAALHGVENPLRTAFRSDPDSHAAKIPQRISDALINSVGTRDAFKRNANATPLEFHCIFEQPSGMNGEYVVGDPEHVRAVAP